MKASFWVIAAILFGYISETYAADSPPWTEPLTDLSPTEWGAILGRLRRAGLLAGEDPHHPGDLDTHPLVREYFGEQLRSQRTEAWKEGNRRLYEYYQTIAPSSPIISGRWSHFS